MDPNKYAIDDIVRITSGRNVHSSWVGKLFRIEKLSNGIMIVMPLSGSQGKLGFYFNKIEVEKIA